MNPAVAPTVAIVLSVTDGDSVRLRVPDWAGTPFGVMTLREIGVDTPESIRHVAKCDAEAAKGLTAKAYAKGLLRPGERVRFIYKGRDKYGGRFLGSLLLPDGREFGQVMVAAGLARPYDGGRKSSWCP
jgi:micrococcal nuclease